MAAWNGEGYAAPVLSGATPITFYLPGVIARLAADGSHNEKGGEAIPDQGKGRGPNTPPPLTRAEGSPRYFTFPETNCSAGQLTLSHIVPFFNPVSRLSSSRLSSSCLYVCALCGRVPFCLAL